MGLDTVRLAISPKKGSELAQQPPAKSERGPSVRPPILPSSAALSRQTRYIHGTRFSLIFPIHHPTVVLVKTDPQVRTAVGEGGRGEGQPKPPRKQNQINSIFHPLFPNSTLSALQ